MQKKIDCITQGQKKINLSLISRKKSYDHKINHIKKFILGKLQKNGKVT